MSNKIMVLRGGAFHYAADSVRCAYRSGDNPNDRYRDLGFRCCVCAP